MVSVDSSSALIVELSESDLGLNVALFSQQLVIFDEVVVEDAARISSAGAAAALNLVLESHALQCLTARERDFFGNGCSDSSVVIECFFAAGSYSDTRPISAKIRGFKYRKGKKNYMYEQ